LTRRGIVDAALQILRDEGLAKVTMRRIATVLDTGPASLYVYVRDTEDLHAQLLDELLADIKLPSSRARRASWRTRLVALLDDYVNLLCAHPEIARMALFTQPTGPNYLALVDAIIGLLADGGASREAAAWGVDAVLLVATASAAEHSREKPQQHRARDSALSVLSAEIEAAGETRFPHLTDVGELLTSGTAQGRLRWRLDVAIDGILANERVR
jgi:AcrR family transcriptional regulator